MTNYRNAEERAKSGGVEGVSVSQKVGGTHDPLCGFNRESGEFDFMADSCARCEFIAKVRADEGQQFVSVLLDNAIVDLDALMAALQARQQSRKSTDI